MVQAFTNGPVVLEPRVGGKFEIFGGNIQGEFIELVSNIWDSFFSFKNESTTVQMIQVLD